jgi:hypothetical protein
MHKIILIACIFNRLHQYHNERQHNLQSRNVRLCRNVCPTSLLVALPTGHGAPLQ